MTMNPQQKNMMRYVLWLGLGLCLTTGAWAQPALRQTPQLQAYQEALELFDKEKYNPAREAFENYLAQYPEGPQAALAQYYLSMSALYLLHDDGERRVRDFVRDYPSHPKAGEALFNAGLFYYQNKDYNKAVQLFTEVPAAGLTRDQGIERRFKLGFALFTLHRFAEAMEQFNYLKRTNHAYTAASNYYAGYIAFEQGDLITAKSDLKTAEQDQAYSAAVPYMLTSILYQEGKYAEVLAYGEEVLLRPRVLRRNDVLLLMGEAYYRQGDYAQARATLEAYQKEQRTAPEPEVAYRLAYSQLATGANEEAVDGFKQLALRKDTLGQYAAYYLGTLYLNSNKTYALNSFRDAAERKLKPDIAAEAMFQSAKLEYELGQTAIAIETLQRFQQKYPNHSHASEVDDLLSEAFLNTNNYNQAIRHIEGLTTKSQKVREVYQKVTYYKATEEFNAGDYPASVELFQKSIQFPIDTDLLVAAYFWSGEAYSIGRRYPQAIRQYGAIFRIDEALGSEYYLKARYGIGYAYYNTKQYDRALTHFRYYTEELDGAQNPQHFEDALIRLGDCYYVTRDYNRALTTYDRAIRQDFSDRDYAYYQKGVILGIQDKVSEALETYATLIRRFPRSRYMDDAVFQRAELQFENGQFEAAVPAFGELIRKLPESPYVPYALQNRAIAYRNLGQHGNTADDYIRLLEQYPTHSVAEDAIFGLQDALSRLGRSGEFSQYLVKYREANPENTELVSVEYEAARNVYLSGEYARAIGTLQDFIARYGASGYASEARFLLAEAYYRLDDYQEAIPAYRDVVRENKVSGINAAYQRLGVMYATQGDLNNAIVSFRQLARRAQTKRESYEAWNGLMEGYYTQANYDSVKHYANLILAQGGVAADANNHANLLSGKSAYQQGRYGEAMDHFAKAIRTAKDVNGAEAQYLQGEILFQQENYDAALDTLIAMNQSFGQYDLWLGRGFILVADVYEAMGESFQAKATLESVIQYSPNKDVVAEARVKLRQLEARIGGDNTPNAPGDSTSTTTGQE